ncbi:MAG: long-chain fatty acid--CoA ligase, partial [Chloroflexota bacterium]|nr:long-chain fatty acid--CoA ligase [Chloroflexota bacterium]
MQTIPTLFATAVEHYDNRLALIEPTEEGGMATLSYRELQEKVHGFAGYLQQQGIEPASHLMIWSVSRSNWLIAYLGALLAGMIVVPLDINSKEDFLVRIADLTEAKLLITTQKQYESLKTAKLPLVDIDSLPQATLDVKRLPPINENDLAEIVYTSGTTGTPKGVMLSHNNIASNAEAAVHVVKIQADDKLLSILPLSHMLELTIEITVLYIGASVVYARSLAPETLLRLLGSEHATCMVLVP